MLEHIKSNALTNLKQTNKQTTFQSRIMYLAELSWVKIKTFSDMWGFKITGGYALVWWGNKSSKRTSSDLRKRDLILKEFPRLIYCKGN